MKASMQYLYENKEENEYRLGLVLLVSAQSGDKALYSQILQQMRGYLASEEGSYKAWRLGRILLAADYIGDDKVVAEMVLLLRGILNDPQTAKDAFSAWAWGYLAGANAEEYQRAKQAMVAAADRLNGSDALWAWVMAVQAAAKRGDALTYEVILQRIEAGESSVALALSKGLQDANGYPAWAFSIVYRAAVIMDDRVLCQELEQPLADAVFAAEIVSKENYNAMAEWVLAQLTRKVLGT